MNIIFKSFKTTQIQFNRRNNFPIFDYVYLRMKGWLTKKIVKIGVWIEYKFKNVEEGDKILLEAEIPYSYNRMDLKTKEVYYNIQGKLNKNNEWKIEWKKYKSYEIHEDAVDFLHKYYPNVKISWVMGIETPEKEAERRKRVNDMLIYMFDYEVMPTIGNTIKVYIKENANIKTPFFKNASNPTVVNTQT